MYIICSNYTCIYTVILYVGLLSSEFQILFRFEPMIKVGKCFSISNGVLKNKNAQYNKTGADYELTLGRSSIIEPCVDSIDGLV